MDARNKSRWLSLCLLLWMMTGCGGSDPESEGFAQAVPAQEGFRDFGDYAVHYRALRTIELRPEVATEYGIRRADNRAMLTVSVIRQHEEGLAGQPVQAQLDVRSSNMLGQVRNLQMREIIDGEAVYYIAELPVVDEEIITFDVQALPQGTSERLVLRFRQQFFLD